MAEVVTEGIYTATIADISESAQETFMVVQPPENIQPDLWDQCMKVAVLDFDGHDIGESTDMIRTLAATGKGSLFAIDVAPFHERHDRDDKDHFTPDMLKAAATYAFKALMLTRGEVDPEAVDNLSELLAK